MRFMMIMFPGPEGESDRMPEKADHDRMGKYNEELVKAGVLLGADGLHPTKRGWRVTAKGGKNVVVDGPFTESKEIVGGFWTIQVKSREEALEWSRKIPLTGAETVEVRQCHEPEDFGDALDPKHAALERKLQNR